MLTGCGDRLHNKFISKTFPLLRQDQWANKSEPCQNKKPLYKGQVPGPPWIGQKPHVGLQMVYKRPSMKSDPYFCIIFGRFVHRPHLTKISISNNTWVLPLNIYTFIYIYWLYMYIGNREGYAESINTIRQTTKRVNMLFFLDSGPWFDVICIACLANQGMQRQKCWFYSGSFFEVTDWRRLCVLIL